MMDTVLKAYREHLIDAVSSRFHPSKAEFDSNGEIWVYFKPGLWVLVDDSTREIIMKADMPNAPAVSEKIVSVKNAGAVLNEAEAFAKLWLKENMK